MTKKTGLKIFKIFLSISLISIIIYSIDWDYAKGALSKANYYLIMLSVIITLLIQILMVYKWSILITTKDSNISVWKLFNINMIAAFLGLFIPSSLSTDLLRGFYLARVNLNKTSSITSILIDRFIGIISLLLFGLVGVLLSKNLFGNLNLIPYLVIIAILFVFPIILLFNNLFTEYFKKIINKLTYKNINVKIIKTYDSLIAFKKHPLKLFFSFLISSLVQFLRIARVYIIALAFNVNVDFYYFFIVVPIVIIVIMVPISIGGLGVREGALVALLKLVGVEVNDAILISITSTLTATFVTLFGGISYIFYKNEVKTELSKERIS